jgi:energy-coupling factor transporter ATP-binding protein EcfA2
MSAESETADVGLTPPADPRTLLAEWANASDEWVRLLVAEVIASGRPVGESTIENAYQLFRQEKALDERTLPVVDQLKIEARLDEAAPPLSVTRLSAVRGVNALVPGEIIDPHEGLTILYGENGTGKTGYSRIFKALADSRTADEILGNIEAENDEQQAAKIDYTVGGNAEVIEWTGERGVSPFTRMSIFDSPSVTTHVDDDLDYVYVPAALALFNHVISAIQAVASRIDETINGLGSGVSTLLSRFPKNSSVYPLIETLGASTDLEALRAKASTDPKIDEKVDGLTQAVAALKANTIGTQITARKRDQRVVQQAAAAAVALLGFDASAFNARLAKRAQLANDYEKFRDELFAAADLPAEPDETWNAFIEAGDTYREHLVELDAHDADRCLYCRQRLADPARDLLARYSTYLEDKISSDIGEADALLVTAKRSVASIAYAELDGFIAEFSDRDDKPTFFAAVRAIETGRLAVAEAVENGHAVELDIPAAISTHKSTVDVAVTAASADISSLEEQSNNRTTALVERQIELAELTAAAELSRSWITIQTQVKNAKEADRLRILKKALPQLARGVTALSKTASDQMINQSFDALFIEECEALRAPALKVQFVGREGKAQRRKVMSGRHKPSKVLSEGEQKVLAIADFLAEARLGGITAPVIFDDPVSSLDHRRINEVAQRIAHLADDNQVIVFTHDIFFATTLLALFEKSKRCSYFQVTDEDGKGKVTRATGPRWDTLGGIKGKINSTIQAATQQEGEARDALVRTGYDWIRSWCEVFTETELLQGVTQRYQPNVGMTKLEKINTEKLGEIIPKVTEVFVVACRYIDGHSQPLATLGVTPTLSGLEEHWQELQDLKKKNDGK